MPKVKEYNNARIIRDTYKKSGLSLSEFAKKCGISVSSITSYITNRSEPRPSTVEKVEKKFTEQVSFNL
jgi:transcriptional regulator with XRE-family HTH domain